MVSMIGRVYATSPDPRIPTAGQPAMPRVKHSLQRGPFCGQDGSPVTFSGSVKLLAPDHIVIVALTCPGLRESDEMNDVCFDMCRSCACVWHGVLVEVKGSLVGISSLLLPHVPWGLNS